MPESPVEKVCTRCSADVASKPRVKDAKGRYLCKPCFEGLSARAQPSASNGTGARGAAPAAAAAASGDDADDNAMIFDLAPVAATPAGGPCPACGRYLAEGVRICVQCGFNAATGGTISTSVAVEKVKGPGKAKRDAHLEAVSRDVHRQAWINAISTLVLGVVSMVIAIGVITEWSPAAFEFYGLTLLILVPAGFLAFVVFALMGAAGGVGFFLIFTEIAAICAAFMPVMVLTSLIPSRIARVVLRGLIMGGLVTWLLDMDEPTNYIFAAVVFGLTIASAVAAAFLLGGGL